MSNYSNPNTYYSAQPKGQQQQPRRGENSHQQRGRNYGGDGGQQYQDGPPPNNRRQLPPRLQQQQPQYLPPPLRQPQQPTLNLNRDFSSAEELLSTLQQFNQSCDIFNNFEIPSASFPGEDGFIGLSSDHNLVGFNNVRQEEFQRPTNPNQYSNSQQQRHQLQNNYFSPEQEQFVPQALRLPEGQYVPPEVLAVILKTQEATEILKSFGISTGEGSDPLTQGNPPVAINQQNQHLRSGASDWENDDIQATHSRNASVNDLGTSSWGPPPAAQQHPYTEMNSANRNNSPGYSGQFSSLMYDRSDLPKSNSKENVEADNSVQPRDQDSRPHQTSSHQWSPSISAKEFVPRFAETDTNTLTKTVAELNTSETGSTRYYPYQAAGDSREDETADLNDEFVLQTVTDSINRLCKTPAEYNRCAKEITAVFKEHSCTLDALVIVVTLLIEQSIALPNFRYSGARLCQTIHDCGIKIEGKTFKVVLLQKCEEEYRKCISDPAQSISNDHRTQGFLMFLAELYLNFQLVVKNIQTPIAILGQATVELMVFLVQHGGKDFGNVKTVVQVLKLLGWDFEHSNNQLIQTHMETLIKDLCCMLALSDDSKTKSVIESIIELKKSDWGRAQDDSSNCSAQNNSYSEGLYYEIPDSDEDDIDERYLVLDDEPDGVCDSYEKFLLEIQEKAKQ